MDSFKKIMKECAECLQISYDFCKTKCNTYRILNTPCQVCGNIGGVSGFIRSTKRGMVEIQACSKCQEMLT